MILKKGLLNWLKHEPNKPNFHLFKPPEASILGQFNHILQIVAINCYKMGIPLFKSYKKWWIK